MTAGRKTTEIAPQEKPVIDGELVNNEISVTALAVAKAQENAVALAKNLGYEGSLNPDALEEGIRESQQRVNFEVFTMGARLLLLKEQCNHGEFAERCNRLDIEGSVARRLMMVSHKFANRATSHDLAKLGKSKLFELAILDDEEASAFAEGQSVRGITYDDAARLSVKALRQKVREQEEQIKAKDRVAADNQARIQKLQEHLATKKPEPTPTPAFAADAALRDLDNEVASLVARIQASLRSYLVKVIEPELEMGEILRQQAIYGAVGRVLAAARQVAQDFDVPVTGVDAADGQGEWDEIWKKSLQDFDAQQAALDGNNEE